MIEVVTEEMHESEMARSSECTEQYAQKVFDRDPHCQRRDLLPNGRKWVRQKRSL